MVTQDYAVPDEGMKENTCRAKNTINISTILKLTYEYNLCNCTKPVG